MITLPADPMGNFIQQLSKEHDRGYVLMAHAFIDERIRELLEKALLEKQENTRALLEKVLEGRSPLDSFLNRVLYLKTFYRIPKELVAALSDFNRLRNQFAHRSHRGELCTEDVDKIYRAMEASDQAEIDRSMCWAGESVVCRNFVSVAAHIYYKLGQLSPHKGTATNQKAHGKSESTAPPPQ